MGFFSVLGLFLGAIGIYGVMAFMVTQRTHEIGVRITLGAQPREILRLVVGKGLWLAAVGIAVGVAGALGMTRLLVFMLAGVSPRDPLTFTGVALLIAAVVGIGIFTYCNIQMWTPLQQWYWVQYLNTKSFPTTRGAYKFLTTVDAHSGRQCRAGG